MRYLRQKNNLTLLKKYLKINNFLYTLISTHYLHKQMFYFYPIVFLESSVDRHFEENRHDFF